MELVRLGKSPFERDEHSVTRNNETGRVEVRFLGPENTSDFRADISWDDVEKLITEFAAMNEPKAIFLRQAHNLAVSARRAGWSPAG
jgi:hypothetical protein